MTTHQSLAVTRPRPPARTNRPSAGHIVCPDYDDFAPSYQRYATTGSSSDSLRLDPSAPVQVPSSGEAATLRHPASTRISGHSLRVDPLIGQYLDNGAIGRARAIYAALIPIGAVDRSYVAA